MRNQYAKSLKYTKGPDREHIRGGAPTAAAAPGVLVILLNREGGSSF